MKLLFLIGDAAVGKMTVGQELAKRTGMRLFHNHMTIEPVIELFGYFHGPTIQRVREVYFEDFAASGEYGMIFTYLWAFDMQSDWDYAEHVRRIFVDRGTDEKDVYYAELIAPQEVRLQRNATENRLKHKPSKHDIEASNQRLLNDDANHRCVSYEGELPFENYIRIENAALPPEEAAKMIQERFDL